MRYTPEFSQAALEGIATEVSPFFVHYFAGPVPATAGEALDMTTLHTQVALLSDGGDGTTGITFDPASGDILPISAVANASGTVTFEGAEDGETSLSPTFFRIGPTSDDCRGEAPGARWQGTLGGPSSGAEIELGSTTVTDNGSNTVGLSSYYINAAAIGL